MNNQSNTATSIHPETNVGLLALTVSDLQRSLNFYENALGFKVLEKTDHSAILGAEPNKPLLILSELPGAKPSPKRSTGLYHFAILTPSRADLGRSIRHLIDVGYPIGGHSDHLVSEAFYLDDPDGNGIEIYRDRPRSEWNWVNGQVQMAADPIDIRGILDAAAAENKPWEGLAQGTTIGHMHLQVANIPEATRFYHDVLGFDIVAGWPSALFISAGGYHHHIGMNTWNSLNGKPAPAGSAGLQFFSLSLPNEEAREAVLARLDKANILYTRKADGVLLYDPWHNGIWLTVGATAPASLEKEAALLQQGS
jgi:catechol 2,3-dioxygenase